MRLSLALLLLLAASPALAADWKPYANPRFGYVIDLPSDFATVSAADNGDGMTLQSKDGKAKLLVFGANLTEENFADDTARRKQSDRDAGWAISYDKSAKGWASYSGTRKDHILYLRALALCEGAGGYFVLDYPKADAALYDPVVAHLVKTLSGPPRCL
jgi:opacity protein-like surface antigen